MTVWAEDGNTELALPAFVEHRPRYLADHSPSICCSRPVGWAAFLSFDDLSRRCQRVCCCTLLGVVVCETHALSVWFTVFEGSGVPGTAAG